MKWNYLTHAPNCQVVTYETWPDIATIFNQSSASSYYLLGNRFQVEEGDILTVARPEGN